MPSKPLDKAPNPATPDQPSSVCILGLGLTGLAVARHFLDLAKPPRLCVYIDKMSQKNQAAIVQLAEQYFNQPALSTESLEGQDKLDFHSTERQLSIRIAAQSLEEDYSLAVVSPGIRPSNPLFIDAQARSAELIGEPELAYRLSGQHWLAVTGTNGKTTTTCLLNHLLLQGGLTTTMAGNIGQTLIQTVAEREDDQYLVVELSSYQLATATSIAPEAAILLNITPDHLEWHGGFEEYSQIKQRVFKHMPLDAPAVIDAQSAVGRRIISECLNTGRRVIGIGIDPEQADQVFGQGRLSETTWQDAAGQLCLRLKGCDHVFLAAEQMAIKGRHNSLNALAAAAVASYIGVSDTDIARGLASFQPLEHRIEAAGEVNGVSFYNDSKATNPEATLMALSAFPPHTINLLLGGEDKHTDLSELVSTALTCCRLVICYGAAARRFYDAFQSSLSAALSATSCTTSNDTPSTAPDAASSAYPNAAPAGGQPVCQVLIAADMQEAMQTAVQLAGPGQVILLSPACASFDQFDSFEQRGQVFKQLVAQLAEQSQFTGEKATEQQLDLVGEKAEQLDLAGQKTAPPELAAENSMLPTAGEQP
jgi:UDP-N-acetylmuramoylalanine--D-glutamate ligase